MKLPIRPRLLLIALCAAAPATASPDPLRVHAAELDLALHVLSKLDATDANTVAFAGIQVEALAKVQPGTADRATRLLLLERADLLLKTQAAKRLDKDVVHKAAIALVALTAGLPREVVTRWNVWSAPPPLENYTPGLAAKLQSQVDAAGAGAAALAKLRLADPWWREPWALSGETDYGKIHTEIESRVALLKALAKQVDGETIREFQESLKVAACRVAKSDDAQARRARGVDGAAAIALWEVQKMAVALHAAHPGIRLASEVFGTEGGRFDLEGEDAGFARFGLSVSTGVLFAPRLPDEDERGRVDMAALIGKDATVRVFAAEGVPPFELPTAKSMGVPAVRYIILPNEPIVVSFAAEPSIAIVVLWRPDRGAQRLLHVPEKLPKNYVFVTDRTNDHLGFLIDREDLSRGSLARLIETSLIGEVAATDPVLRMFAKSTGTGVKSLSTPDARAKALAALNNTDAKLPAKINRADTERFLEALAIWRPIGGLAIPPALSSLGYLDWHTEAIGDFSTDFLTKSPSGDGPWPLRRFHTAKE
ncbi:MAG: hypothetical protein V3T86_13170 [Planctomycetota bacterium]